MHIHPQSLPITPGWSNIGPQTRKAKALTPATLSKAFKDTLKREHNHHIAKLRNKLAQGSLSEDQAVLALLECSLAAKPLAAKKVTK